MINQASIKGMWFYDVNLQGLSLVMNFWDLALAVKHVDGGTLLCASFHL